jgi:hypothetical protein
MQPRVVFTFQSGAGRSKEEIFDVMGTDVFGNWDRIGHIQDSRLDSRLERGAH